MTYKLLTIFSPGAAEDILLNTLRKRGHEAYSYSDVVKEMVSGRDIPEDDKFYEWVVDEVRPDVICVDGIYAEVLYGRNKLPDFVEQLGTEIPVVFYGFDNMERDVFDAIEHPNKHFIASKRGVREWVDNVLRYLDRAIASQPKTG